MDNYQFDYLKLQYEEGAKIIKYRIDCRYKILQFTGYYNAAVLTFGFSEKILLESKTAIAGIAISLLSIFVALMGLATEFSVSTYNVAYFEMLRKIEEALGQIDNERIIDKLGMATSGRITAGESKFQKNLPVHQAHKIFYTFLVAGWIGLFLYEIYLLWL